MYIKLIMKFESMATIMDKMFDCNNDIQNVLILLKNSNENMNYYILKGNLEKIECIMHIFVFENDTISILIEIKNLTVSKVYGCFNFTHLTIEDLNNRPPFNLISSIFNIQKELVTIKKIFLDNIKPLLRQANFL